MLRTSRFTLLLRLQAATFVENPVNRVASVTLQIVRTRADEPYGFNFRQPSKVKGSNLKLSQIPRFVVEASPVMDALFPDKGRIYAGTGVFLTSVNGISAIEHKRAIAEFNTGQYHTVNLSVQMGPRRSVKTKTQHESEEEVDEDLDEGEKEIAKVPTMAARKKEKLRAPSRERVDARKKIDKAVSKVLEEMAPAPLSTKAAQKAKKTAVAEEEEGEYDETEEEVGAADLVPSDSVEAMVKEVSALKELLADSVAAIDTLRSGKRKYTKKATASKSKKAAAPKKAKTKKHTKPLKVKKTATQKKSKTQATEARRNQRKRTSGSGKREKPLKEPVVDVLEF